MSRTVDIPGGTATFRTTDELRARDADLIEAAIGAAQPALAKLPPELAMGPKEGETPEQFAERTTPLAESLAFDMHELLLMTQLRRATTVATLESWTLDRPLPTMDTIGDLPRDLVQELDKAIGGAAGAVATSTSFEPILDARGQPVKDSPTIDSGSSNSPSPADPESTSIQSPPEDTGSTDTGASIPD